jgi:hypothetical protein
MEGWKEGCVQYMFHISGNLSTVRSSPATKYMKKLHNPSLQKVAFLVLNSKEVAECFVVSSSYYHIHTTTNTMVSSEMR